MPADVIYKICTASEWAEALSAGQYTGSADDARDGFIHLSTVAQLAVTAAKYFSHKPDLVLVAVATEAAGRSAPLKWERSRGGALFPHLYGPLPQDAVLWVRPLPLGADGVPLVMETMA
jgi:uncharacterized protein (DUF952 family)